MGFVANIKMTGSQGFLKKRLVAFVSLDLLT
jgi:hypothetical protein